MLSGSCGLVEAKSSPIQIYLSNKLFLFLFLFHHRSVANGSPFSKQIHIIFNIKTKDNLEEMEYLTNEGHDLARRREERRAIPKRRKRPGRGEKKREKKEKKAVIRENINMDNVLSILIIAEVCNVPLLKSVALEFIEENAREVMADPGRREKLSKHPKIEGFMFEAMMRDQLSESSPDIVESYDKMETYRELTETIDKSHFSDIVAVPAWREREFPVQLVLSQANVSRLSRSKAWD